MKNEQYNAEMVDILEYTNSFLSKCYPETEGLPEQIFFEGDYLTFERAKVAQASKQNSPTSSECLDAFIMKAAEFHNQAEFLRVSFMHILP